MPIPQEQLLKYGALWIQLKERHLLADDNLICLPLRKLPIEFDGDFLIICGKRKIVLSNRNAINFLYNIDNNKCKADDWDLKM